MNTANTTKARSLLLAALLCLVAAFNALGAETGGAETLEHALISFHWQWQEHGKVGERSAEFKPNGDLRNPMGAGVAHYHWQVTGRRTFTLTSPKGISYFTINEDLTQFDGEHAGTNAHITGARLDSATNPQPAVSASTAGSGSETPANSPPPATPQPKPKPVNVVPDSTPPVKSVGGAANLPPGLPTKIDELREHVSTMRESILAPPEQPVAAGLRDYIGDLKEDLMDEAARKPAASATAYGLAVQLCDSLVAVGSEREVMLARLNNNLPTNATAGASPAKVHPNWVDLEIAIHQAAAATRNNKLETTFHKQIRVQWGLHAAELRKTLELQVSLFRTALRQSPQQK
jgi:hypothetical protein